MCVYCFRVFTSASQYIAHAGSHREADTTKDSYIAQICDSLRKRVEDELRPLLRKSHYLPDKDENSARKRSIDAADLNSIIPDAQRTIRRTDLYGVNETTTDAASLAPFHDVIGISPRLYLVVGILTFKKILGLVTIFRPPCHLSLLLRPWLPWRSP